MPKMNTFVKLLVFLPACLVSVNADRSANDTQAVAAKRIRDWQSQYNKYVLDTLGNRTKAGNSSSSCTLDKLDYRREWGSLSRKDRIEYTNAVQCLQKKPNKVSNIRVLGARSRFDDVISSHYFQSLFIHFSGIFLPWHRYYVWIYTKMLRDECGYTGPTPYWDWTLTYEDPRQSKIFDGSVDSMGSNGKSIPHGPLLTHGFGLNFTVPAATGGGCVTSGPFVNYTVNLGPTNYEPTVGNGTGLDYNPRCMKRDVSLDFAKYTKPTDVVDLIDSTADLEAFSSYVEKPNGLHGSGHFIIGGDPGSDAYYSAGDPIFYLHHAQIDRLWTIWQGLDPARRFGQAFGTSTAFNQPPSANVTLDTEIHYELLSEPPTVGEVDSPIDGPFCYIYV